MWLEREREKKESDGEKGKDPKEGKRNVCFYKGLAGIGARQSKRSISAFFFRPAAACNLRESRFVEIELDGRKEDEAVIQEIWWQLDSDF